jgi:hypothetical protein
MRGTNNSKGQGACNACDFQSYADVDCSLMGSFAWLQVLQYHPDVNHAGGAERKFMSIQQAYELLTSKSRHPEGYNGRRSDWAFHDW